MRDATAHRRVLTRAFAPNRPECRMDRLLPLAGRHLRRKRRFPKCLETSTFGVCGRRVFLPRIESSCLKFLILPGREPMRWVPTNKKPPTTSLSRTMRASRPTDKETRNTRCGARYANRRAQRPDDKQSSGKTAAARAAGRGSCSQEPPANFGAPPPALPEARGDAKMVAAVSCRSLFLAISPSRWGRSKQFPLRCSCPGPPSPTEPLPSPNFGSHYRPGVPAIHPPLQPKPSRTDKVVTGSPGIRRTKSRC